MKRAKRPVVEPVLSPWMLCIWRGEVERCHYGLVRFEHGPVIRAITAVHAMFVGSTGVVLYRKYRADTAQLAEPTMVNTSVDSMIAYFKRRLLLIGGDPEAYEALGLQKPINVETPNVVTNPAKARELEDLYTRAAKLLEVPEDELQARYSHLNRGLQAMNLRNRLRAKGHNV